ncbi:MAG: GFA family protein [Pikeienuella sp.]
MERTGGCACGAIRFKVAAPFTGVGACHCTDCQKATGGGPNYVALAPTAAFTVTKGAPKTYTRKGDSGADAVRAFCGDCGTPLWSAMADTPFMPVRLGAFDDHADLKPAMHIYVSSAPAWHPIGADAVTFPKMPPPPA